MLQIHQRQLPVDERALRAALARYVVALEEHRTTLGVPAPWPEYDVLRDILVAGGDFRVIPEEETPPPTPIVVEPQAALAHAVQQHLDTTARAHGYDNIFSAVTYAEETAVAQFQAEGRAFRRWRSLVWARCYELLAEVRAGTRAIPTQAELLALLPVLVLP